MSKYGQLDVAKEDEIGEGLGLDELNIAGGIEQVSEFDLKYIADMEKFMNERLVILVFPDRSEGALRVIRPEVNGLCQPILRGVKTKVKRKYVEALARTISTAYDQVQRDPSRRIRSRSSMTRTRQAVHGLRQSSQRKTKESP